MYCLYLLHRLLNFILGKTITEKYDDAVEMKYSSNFANPEKQNKNYEQEKEEIYVINDEDYK